MHIQYKNNFRKGLPIGGFVGLISEGDAMWGSWAVLPQVDMDNKIYSESFIENIFFTKCLCGRNLCQVQFYKSFSLLQLNWDTKCILIG